MARILVGGRGQTSHTYVGTASQPIFAIRSLGLGAVSAMAFMQHASGGQQK
ncbi:hypothetical protein RUND412_007202 [Rhizina undulata]